MAVGEKHFSPKQNSVYGLEFNRKQKKNVKIEKKIFKKKIRHVPKLFFLLAQTKLNTSQSFIFFFYGIF